MREIKFRAWDEDDKQLRDWAYMQDSLQLWLSGFYAVMQYTGLKDVNGVEIYEGDLLKDNLGIQYSVFYSYGGYKLIQKEDISIQLPLMDTNGSWYEVIGNIYENPQLLENSNG